MKKLLITLLCLLTLTASCKQKSSETTGGESAEVAVAEGAAQNVTPQQLAEKWSEKAIAVKGGGDKVKSVSVDGRDLPDAFVPEALLRDGSQIRVVMA